MNKHGKTPIKFDELKVRGIELLFEQLSLRANTTLNVMMILFLSFSSPFFDPHFLGGLSHYIVSFFRSLSYTCSLCKPPLKYMSHQPSFVNGGG